jgi:hypothetical protein
MNIEIYGTKYTGKNKIGDFEWMIKQPTYANSLFIFNDNEEHHNTNIIGGGNAVIRSYNKYHKFVDLNKPRSAGIPTGTLKNGGYTFLTNIVQKTIDNSINEIMELIQTYKYDSIYYSVGLDNKLGTGIFNVNQDVINYIDTLIQSLSMKEIIYL